MEFKKVVAVEPEIIYESESFLAVNKPAGLLVHGTGKEGAGKIEPTLIHWLLKRYPEIKKVGDDRETRPGIVHRLDKETSGVILIAKTQKYFEYLKSLFQERKIKKIYLALVYGKVEPKSGIIEKPIGIKNGTLKRSVRSEKMAKEAITEYKVRKHILWNMEQKAGSEPGEKRQQALSLLEVSPKTGRTHQIRVHLASIGYPVVGDKLYGPKKLTPVRLMLHALALEFETGPGKRIRMEAETPEEFKAIINELKD